MASLEGRRPRLGRILRGPLRGHLRMTVPAYAASNRFPLSPSANRPMNTSKGIVLKLVSAVLFAVMSALIRYLGARYPIGEVVFYRSAFAIVPVVLVYAWRGELA